MGIFDAIKDTVANTINDQLQGHGSETGSGSEKLNLAQAASQILNHFGGVNGLVQAFESKGLGDIARSWVGNGPNEPVSPDQVHTALGSEPVEAASRSTGLPKQELLGLLALFLPKLIDHLTPNGQTSNSTPSSNQLMAALSSFLK